MAQIAESQSVEAGYKASSPDEIRDQLKELYEEAKELSKGIMTFEKSAGYLVIFRKLKVLDSEAKEHIACRVNEELIPIREALSILPELSRDAPLAQAQKTLTEGYYESEYPGLKALQATTASALYDVSDYLTALLKEVNEAIRKNGASATTSRAVVSEGREMCEFCKKSYSNKSALRQHVAKFHPAEFRQWKDTHYPGKGVTQHEKELMGEFWD